MNILAFVVAVIREKLAPEAKGAGTPPCVGDVSGVKRA